MARSAHPTNGLQAYILILAMTTIVTVFSASTIHGGARDFPLGVVRADAPVAALPVRFGARDLSFVHLEEAAGDPGLVLAPPASKEAARERFIGEGGRRAHVGGLSSTRGSDHSDTRVLLLEATAQLRNRGEVQEQRDVASRSLRVMTDN